VAERLNASLTSVNPNGIAGPLEGQDAISGSARRSN